MARVAGMFLADDLIPDCHKTPFGFVIALYHHGDLGVKNNKAPSGAFFFIVFAQVSDVLDDDCPR